MSLSARRTRVEVVFCVGADNRQQVSPMQHLDVLHVAGEIAAAVATAAVANATTWCKVRSQRELLAAVVKRSRESPLAKS